jgi:hypothetical protein
VSRDGVRWHVYDSEDDKPYMQRGRGGWIHDGLVLRGDHIWQYINRGNKNVARVLQRLDGFVSVDAGQRKGMVITQPFIFEGDKLTVNVDAGKGLVKVAILDLPGQEMSGYNVGLTNRPKKDVRNYSIAHCDPITTDSVRHVVTWKGRSDVSNLAGKIVRLRIEMQNAKLFALQFK